MKLLSISILTVGLLFGTLCSANAESLTKEQAEKLADRIMEHTPKENEYKTKFEWVVLEDIKDNPEILNTAVLEKIKKKYQVFNNKKDIPEKFKVYQEGIFRDYTGGFTFYYNVTFVPFDTPIPDAYFYEYYHKSFDTPIPNTHFRWLNPSWEEIKEIHEGRRLYPSWEDVITNADYDTKITVSDGYDFCDNKGVLSGSRRLGNPSYRWNGEEWE